MSNYEAPKNWVPATLTADQVREVNALNAVEVELIDEAVGRVMRYVAGRGWDDDVDVVFTSDHGELQGDFGLLFKGPYHVDALLRLPLVWRPAPSRGVTPSVVTAPVSLVSLAATFCEIAGQPPPTWVEGASLPVDDEDAHARGFDATVTEWDSSLFGVDVHVRTVVTGEHLLTEYGAGTQHEGSEGELYVLGDDPLQRVNRFEDPACAERSRRAARATGAPRGATGRAGHARRFSWPRCDGDSVVDVPETVISGPPFDPVEPFRHVPLPAWEQSGEYRDIIYEVAEGIARITINRPERRNAFRPQTLFELAGAFERARDDVARGRDHPDRHGTRRVLLRWRPVDPRRRRLHGRRLGRRGRAWVGSTSWTSRSRFGVSPSRSSPLIAGYAIGGGHILHLVCDLSHRGGQRAIRPDRPAGRLL